MVSQASATLTDAKFTENWCRLVIDSCLERIHLSGFECEEAGVESELMALWSDDDEIACVHPGGPRVIGHAAIRASFEGFLRFTHRYWFHEVSEQAQARALFRLCTTHLGLDALHASTGDMPLACRSSS